ncbi:S-layer family protein [Lentilactobacillus otakiensis]|uniref:S-layer family protein n=1 Tax=Lentilactobacillus otakiensis TaxID=481720 RepID=UPI001CC0F103|nr:S-layer family protein [Lentilactobacillus otakiensis]MBZ3776523.1 S-layer family protein [Lentilactobacillus otakiensis]
MRGARVVASKRTLAQLAASNNSQSNVRAYRVAITNRGSVYYKVVTFDGQHRGWIYGGKSTGKFGGGLTKYSTFNNQGMSALTAAQQNATYKITTPGTQNDGKSVTYKAPSWTQYKVGRAITDSTIYANTNFKIDQVGTRTRENDQWVHIYDPNNASSSAAGWILFSGLTQNQAVDQVADNAIRVNLVDASGKTIKSFDYSRANAQKGTTFGINNNGVWSITQADQSDILSKIQSALNGTFYGLNSLSSAQMTQIAQATFGSFINITVNAVSSIADNAVRINLIKSDGTVIKSFDWMRTGATRGTTVGSLSADEQGKLQDSINSQLTGTGFALANSTLTPAQIQKITQGSFGGQVYVEVSPVASAVSPITIYDGLDATGTLLTGTTSEYATAQADFKLTDIGPEIKLSPAEFMKQDPKANGSVIAQINALTGTDRTDAISAVNRAFKNAAEHQYNSTNVNLSGLTGKPGDSFTSGMVIDYLNSNKLNTLLSPKYVELGDDLNPTDKTITYSVVLESIQGGKFGDPARVLYLGDETKASASVAK